MNPNEIVQLTNELGQLEQEETELQTKIRQQKEKIRLVNLAYHKKLIAADFYTRYKFYGNSGKTLNTMFNLGSMGGMWLPEADHGDGDYIRIKFKVVGGDLNLVYQCSYNKESNCSLIRLALNLFIDGNEHNLKQSLDNFFEQAEKDHQKIVDADKRRKLDELNRQIKLLQS